MQASEVGEHATWEVALRRGLIFYMDEKEGGLVTKAGFHHQIDLILFACGDIGEDLFVEELDAGNIEEGGDIGNTAEIDAGDIGTPHLV